jgi:hypothetical protein
MYLIFKWSFTILFLVRFLNGPQSLTVLYLKEQIMYVCQFMYKTVEASGPLENQTGNRMLPKLDHFI